MKTKGNAIAGAALLALSQLASAAEPKWYAFAPMADAAGFLQSDDIDVRGPIRTVWWLLIQYENPNPAGGFSMRMRVRIDCAAQTFQSLYVAHMDKQRTVLAVGDEESPRVGIPPGTVIARLQSVVCRPDFPRGLATDQSLRKVDNPPDPYVHAVMFGLLQSR